MPPTPPSILVVDDDADVVSWLVESLAESGYDAIGVTGAISALERLEQRAFDVVVSDVVMPEMRGTELLDAVRRRQLDTSVILITAFGSIDLAVQTVRAGAADFIAKPFEIEALVTAIERALAGRVRGGDNDPDGADEGGIVARSDAMRTALSLARRAAATDSVVLLTGESGVGKGALARFIHARSARADGPFIQVNCAALPSQLVESELFGVRRGAYTDARENRAGLFVEASGGTLFLDEIGELPQEAQPKLLHALETARVRPVGAPSETAVDVRLIAATNVSLEEALEERRLRPDLYYRLNVIRVEIPPLRERGEDIAPLVEVLLARHTHKLRRPLAHLTPEALAWIRMQRWPGNVRELSNVLERAVALADHDAIVVGDLGTAATAAGDVDSLAEALASGLPLADVERAYIRRVLAAVDGNVAQAARILGIDRRTVYRRLKDL
jgi:DNA-binding NtrC family response regulator